MHSGLWLGESAYSHTMCLQNALFLTALHAHIMWQMSQALQKMQGFRYTPRR